MFICLMNPEFTCAVHNTKRELILSSIKSYRWRTLYAVIAGLAFTLLTVLIPVFIGKFYELAFHSGSARGQLLDQILGPVVTFNQFFLSFGVLLLLRFILSYISIFSMNMVGEQFVHDVRSQLFGAQISTALKEYEKKDVGKYLLRYSGDLSSVRRYLIKGILTFTNDCLFLIFAIAIFAAISLPLAAVILVIFPVLFLASYLFNKRLRSLVTERRNKKSALLAFTSARLHAVSTIKAFNRESIESEKFNKRSKKIVGVAGQYYAWNSLQTALLPFLIYVMLAVIMMFMVYGDEGQSLPPAALIIFIMIVLQSVPVFRRLLQVNTVWQSGDVSLSKILFLLNAPKEEKAIPEASNRQDGSIVFSNTGFAYSGEHWIFRHLNIQIEKGSLVRVTGPQGSGKSTLLKLLLGLYTPTEGKILVGGLDTRFVSPFHIRKKVTVVSEQFPLLGNTVFQAVSYSRKEERRPAALQVLREIGFAEEDDETILDRRLEDGGKRLSEGQFKLLLLARALLTGKRIMLLDQPFKGLDAQHLSKVLLALSKRRKTHTIILIDSDPSIQLSADYLLQLAGDGSIQYKKITHENFIQS